MATLALPLVLFGQVRRNTKARIFLLEASAIVYAFTAAAFRSNPPSIPDDPLGLLRLAIPAAAALLVLLVRNSNADPEGRTQYACALDVAIALALAVLSQSVLAWIAPGLALPHWAPTQGAAVGWWFLTLTRALFPPGPNIPAHVPLVSPASLGEIRWKAQEFERNIRRRNTIVYIAVAIVSVVFAAPFFGASIPRTRAGSALILAGVMYLTFEIRGRGLPEAVPTEEGSKEGNLIMYVALYRQELERQYALLRRVWYWYFGSLIPGCLLLLHGSRVYEYVLLLPILLLAEVHLRAAEKLRRDLSELNSLERFEAPLSVAYNSRSTSQEAK